MTFTAHHFYGVVHEGCLPARERESCNLRKWTITSKMKAFAYLYLITLKGFLLTRKKLDSEYHNHHDTQHVAVQSKIILKLNISSSWLILGMF
jgi:hypothetical protein